MYTYLSSNPDNPRTNEYWHCLSAQIQNAVFVQLRLEKHTRRVYVRGQAELKLNTIHTHTHHPCTTTKLLSNTCSLSWSFMMRPLSHMLPLAELLAMAKRKFNLKISLPFYSYFIWHVPNYGNFFSPSLIYYPLGFNTWFDSLFIGHKSQVVSPVILTVIQITNKSQFFYFFRENLLFNFLII